MSNFDDHTNSEPERITPEGYQPKSKPGPKCPPGMTYETFNSTWYAHVTVEVDGKEAEGSDLMDMIEEVVNHAAFKHLPPIVVAGILDLNAKMVLDRDAGEVKEHPPMSHKPDSSDLETWIKSPPKSATEETCPPIKIVANARQSPHTDGRMFGLPEIGPDDNLHFGDMTWLNSSWYNAVHTLLSDVPKKLREYYDHEGGLTPWNGHTNAYIDRQLTALPDRYEAILRQEVLGVIPWNAHDGAPEMTKAWFAQILRRVSEETIARWSEKGEAKQDEPRMDPGLNGEAPEPQIRRNASEHETDAIPAFLRTPKP